MFRRLFRRGLSGLAIAGALAGAASAAQVTVTVTNEFGDGGPFLTPLFTAFHDGSFDYFDAGSAASAATEALAEEGDPAGLIAEAGAAGATTGVIFGNDVAPPPINPGESASLTFDLDPMTDRYLSFASMVIPSNDLFIGNDSATAYEVFDAGGAFQDLVIQVRTRDVWDAGTEANNNIGAAFNAAGGVGTPTMDPVALLPTGAALSQLLTGQETVLGSTIDFQPGNRPLATITVSISEVPLPAGAPLLLAGLGALGFAARRRRWH